MKTFPTPTAVRILLDSGLLGQNVSTRAGGAGALPASRVTLIRDAEPAQEWSTAIFQVEIWADDELEAGDLAYEVAQHWDDRASGDVNGVHLSGTWIESAPRPFDDPDTEAHRYIMEVGAILSKENPDG